MLIYFFFDIRDVDGELNINKVIIKIRVFMLVLVCFICIFLMENVVNFL